MEFEIKNTIIFTLTYLKIKYLVINLRDIHSNGEDM